MRKKGFLAFRSYMHSFRAHNPNAMYLNTAETPDTTWWDQQADPIVPEGEDLPLDYFSKGK
eukprot:6361144-Heterocapsa_arctica.AAC.1